MAVPTEVTFRLSRSRSSVPRARALLRAMLEGWPVDGDVLDTAELVLSELVTSALNAPAPDDRQVTVCIEHLAADGLLRLEVSDAGEGVPELRRPGEEELGGRGLLLVEELTHRWGVRQRAGGIGKTVYAELKAPCVVAAPAVARIAALAVQPGQEVELRGRWYTVRSVGGARGPTGEFFVRLGLSHGLTLRFSPVAPLTVRDGGGSFRPGDREDPPPRSVSS